MGLSIIYCQDLKGLCVIAVSQTQHLSELCDMMCRFGHIDPLFIDDRLRDDLIVLSLFVLYSIVGKFFFHHFIIRK